MDKPGRKSAAERHLASVTVLPVGQLKPPDELTEEQGKIWTEIVQSKPDDWFGRDSHALLVNYCIAVIRRRAITREIERKMGLKRPNVGQLEKLHEMERRQIATISSLSTKMRLSQQSKYGPRAADTASKHYPGVQKPWEQSA
ncbi:MAG TPA: hypothetical protein VGF89_01000 [Steroidobacteraceae bacterium]|jgi:hypothetical protein